jgi:predicted RNA-binding protein with PIN domain
MIRAVVAAERLVLHLRARADRIAAARADTMQRERNKQGAQWRSAAALWPDLFGETTDGK